MACLSFSQPRHGVAQRVGNPKWTDGQLFDFMMRCPILINRPIVVTSRGVKHYRPSEKVLDILLNPDIGAFAKEESVMAKSAAADLHDVVHDHLHIPGADRLAATSALRLAAGGRIALSLP